MDFYNGRRFEGRRSPYGYNPQRRPMPGNSCGCSQPERKPESRNDCGCASPAAQTPCSRNTSRGAQPMPCGRNASGPSPQPPCGQNASASSPQSACKRNASDSSAKGDCGQTAFTRPVKENAGCGCGQALPRKTEECGCQEGNSSPKRHEFPSDFYPVGMAYVPTQIWGETYELCKAFQVGTIFPILDKPFTGRCPKR